MIAQEISSEETDLRNNVVFSKIRSSVWHVFLAVKPILWNDLEIPLYIISKLVAETGTAFSLSICLALFFFFVVVAITAV